MCSLLILGENIRIYTYLDAGVLTTEEQEVGNIRVYQRENIADIMTTMDQVDTL